MTKFDKCTCVKVNKEKMDLIKSKGLNLQDLLDKAMDNELKLSEVSDTQQKIDDLTNKIEKLKEERKDSIIEYEKRMTNVIKLIEESKKKEEIYYDKQINYYELQLEYIKKNV